MKTAAIVLPAAALAIAALSATASLADPINRYTITGRSAAAAVAQGVPLDQTPKPPSPAAVEGDAAAGAAQATAVAADGAAPAEGAAPAAERKPRTVRYGLLGLSWRTEP